MSAQRPLNRLGPLFGPPREDDSARKRKQFLKKFRSTMQYGVLAFMGKKDEKAAGLNIGEMQMMDPLMAFLPILGALFAGIVLYASFEKIKWYLWANKMKIKDVSPTCTAPAAAV